MFLYVMFKTRAAVFYQDLKPRGEASCIDSTQHSIFLSFFFFPLRMLKQKIHVCYVSSSNAVILHMNFPAQFDM